jgi:AcrR family transcriptional regulator
MPRPRFSKLAPARQREIFECAGAEFAAHGYQHASLNRIIGTLGLNKGVFYYYFDGKADLFASVVKSVWDRFFPVAGFDVAALDERTFWPRLMSLLRASHARLREEPWLAGITRLLLLNPPQSAGVDAVIAELLARGQTWAKAVLQRGQEVGAVRTDLPVDLLLDVISTADQAADHWLLANWDRYAADEREQASFQIFDLWRRIAAPTPVYGLRDAAGTALAETGSAPAGSKECPP